MTLRAGSTSVSKSNDRATQSDSKRTIRVRPMKMMKSFILALFFSFSLTVVSISPGATAQEAEEGPAERLDHEIAQLEEKRAAELLFFVQLLVQQKDYVRAAEQVSRILIVPPTSTEGLARLRSLSREVALGVLRIGKSADKAAELCERLTTDLGEDAILLYIASLANKERGNEAKRKEYEEKARAVQSGNQAYWFDVGSFFAKKQEFSLALEAFKTVAAISPDNPTHHSADSEAAMAAIYCRLGDYAEALRHSESLQEIARQIVVSRTDMAALMAMVYAARGRQAEIEERYDAAIEDYTKSSEFSPQPGGAYHSIGDLYLKMKKYTEAEDYFNRAISAGGVPMAYAGLGDVRKALGEGAEAETKYEKCEDAFAEAIEREPQNASNYNNLAWYYATHDKELDKGIELAKKAVALAPDSPEYLDTLAELYYLKGDREAAIREIRKALDLKPAHTLYYQKQLKKFQKESDDGEAKRVDEDVAVPE